MTQGNYNPFTGNQNFLVLQYTLNELMALFNKSFETFKI